MTMTTDEARTKMCHISMAYAGPSPFTRCQADGCMAWRWHLSPKRIAIAKALVAAGNATQHEQSFAAATPAGYCGLAGAIGLD